MVKVKVYNGWVGVYVGEGDYEGGSMDNYEFNSISDDYSYVLNKCLELYDRVSPCSEIRMFKFRVYDKNGKLLTSGKYNDTPYKLVGDKNKYSTINDSYQHVVVSKVKSEY
jgi:hypothetical protein